MPSLNDVIESENLFGLTRKRGLSSKVHPCRDNDWSFEEKIINFWRGWLWKFLTGCSLVKLEISMSFE